MLKVIDVEVYDESTFVKWTDGPKYIIELDMSCSYPIPTTATHFYADTLDEVEYIISGLIHSCGTLFLICNLDDFIVLHDKYPKLNLRFLHFKSTE